MGKSHPTSSRTTPSSYQELFLYSRVHEVPGIKPGPSVAKQVFRPTGLALQPPRHVIFNFKTDCITLLLSLSKDFHCTIKKKYPHSEQWLPRNCLHNLPLCPPKFKLHNSAHLELHWPSFCFSIMPSLFLLITIFCCLFSKWSSYLAPCIPRLSSFFISLNVLLAENEPRCNKHLPLAPINFILITAQPESILWLLLVSPH